MARFRGIVGFGVSTEVPALSGIWKDVITEAPYSGDVLRDTSNLQPSDNLNDNITLANSISILSDQYAIENYADIKYVVWGGVRWTVTSVEVRRPRLILRLGDVYNGPLPEPSEPEEP